jgi:hypothetical protein
MLQLLFSFGNLIPNALNVLLNLGYPLRTFVLDDLLHSSLLCFHHISYILLCDSFVLDLLEQSVDLSVLGLNFGLRFCDLLSINGLFSNDLLLNVLQFFLANIKPFFFHFFLHQFHPPHEIPPQFILYSYRLTIRQKQWGLGGLPLLLIQIFLQTALQTSHYGILLGHLLKNFVDLHTPQHTLTRTLFTRLRIPFWSLLPQVYLMRKVFMQYNLINDSDETHQYSWYEVSRFRRFGWICPPNSRR